jgi:hypothetical protein
MKRGALMVPEDKPVLYSLFLCGWLWLLSGAGQTWTHTTTYKSLK